MYDQLEKKIFLNNKPAMFQQTIQHVMTHAVHEKSEKGA